MIRTKIVVLLVLIASLALAGTVFADHITFVTYEDTVGLGPEVEAGGLGSLVSNGDFSLWNADGTPVDWHVWADSIAGWEDAHFAKMDLALGAPGENYGAGLFVRNVGGAGSYYAGIRQHLDAVTTGGYYWINIHETIWYGGGTSGYNSMAWYTISSEEDPYMATGWRELDPFTIQCPNTDGACLRVSRQETVWVDPGSYLHIAVGHKWPVYNAWSVFAIDDISLVPASGSPGDSGFFFDGAVFWDPTAVR